MYMRHSGHQTQQGYLRMKNVLAVDIATVRDGRYVRTYIHIQQYHSLFYGHVISPDMPDILYCSILYTVLCYYSHTHTYPYIYRIYTVHALLILTHTLLRPPYRTVHTVHTNLLILTSLSSSTGMYHLSIYSHSTKYSLSH